MAEERSGESTPRQVDAKDTELSKDEKKKRSLFGLAKKKTGESTKTGSSKGSATDTPTESPSMSREHSKLPSQNDPHFALPVSPSQASPRISSPARSLIFERDVQDSTMLPPNSPAIPTHIQTENHIPPVLDDASEAITNSKLDPDTVEIVTHNSHQPAALTVTGGCSTMGSTMNSPYECSASEWAEELTSFADRQTGVAPDNASNYGSLESADVRRLSFISFADVVQSEQQGGFGGPGSRDSIHMAGLTSIPSGINRSPSPVRSPVSSHGLGTSQELGTSPPTSNPASVKGVEMSPHRKPLGSPGSGIQNLSLSPPGDLNIETMTQALRRTGSAELNTVRSMPTSPVEGPGSR